MLDKHFRVIVAACLVAIAAVLVLPVLWRYVPSARDIDRGIDSTIRGVQKWHEENQRQFEVERCARRYKSDLFILGLSQESDPKCKAMMEAWALEERCRARISVWVERGALPKTDECFNQNAWQWLEEGRKRKEHEAMKERIRQESEAWAKQRDERWKAEKEEWDRKLQELGGKPLRIDPR